MNLEILVIDDASTDETEHYLKKINVPYIRNSSNLGVAYSRNFGAKNAKSEILFFIDSDVFVDPSTVIQLPPALQKNSQYQALGLRPKLSDQFGQNWGKSIVELQAYWPTHFLPPSGILPLSGLQSECCIIWKNTFFELKGFDERFTQAGIEEFEFGYRMKKFGYKMALV